MRSLADRFKLREEIFGHRGFTAAMLLPESADQLIDEAEFDADERLPYWAELWPSARALARDLLDAPPTADRALELGCGLALPSLALSWRGANVVATDYYDVALEFVRLNAERNAIAAPETRALDWREPDPSTGKFDLVLAADVLYERRNAGSLAAVLRRITSPGGTFRLADPGRRYRADFDALMAASGWSVAREHVVEEVGEIGARTVTSRIRITDFAMPG